jgi:hypothetical protein
MSYESPVTSRTPDRAARCYTAALGCDVTQQGSEVRNVTGCYATLDKQSLSALGSDVTYTSQLHSTQRCYGEESTVLGYHVTPCVSKVKTVYWTAVKRLYNDSAIQNRVSYSSTVREHGSRRFYGEVQF